MGEQFFLSLQQNIKLFLWMPILCAIFRAIFIGVYHPYETLKGKGHIVRTCFTFGFWWGMDINAYQLLILLVLGTLPFLAFPDYYMMAAIVLNTVLSCIIYAAFAGKMQFYKHFNDTYNYMLHYGKHADKKNLIDIFFNQDKGWWVLAGFIPVAAISYGASTLLSAIPSIPYPHFESNIAAGASAFGYLVIYLSLIHI